MVGSVEVLPVPTGGEEDLGTETTWAVVVGNVIGLGLVRAEAVEGDGLCIKAASEVAFEWISGEHAETFWEG